ncbi:hypothetical protein EV363DRAFT_1454853 [Boletus edulis]|nr:hypothetical protein EV363DRAFT_1454853 [Boletus edulis]
MLNNCSSIFTSQRAVYPHFPHQAFISSLNAPIPTPESLTPEEFKGFLKYLDTLLQNLPDALSVGIPTASKYDIFLSFTLDDALQERTGCEIGAFNEQFKGIFGWKARTTGDGILPIEERGEPICAVVSILRGFHEKHPNDVIVKKWAVDIALGAEKLYKQYGIEVL